MFSFHDFAVTPMERNHSSEAAFCRVFPRTTRQSAASSGKAGLYCRCMGWRFVYGGMYPGNVCVSRALRLVGGGEGGIRTPGAVSPHTRFPGEHLKPLSHLSVVVAQFILMICGGCSRHDPSAALGACGDAAGSGSACNGSRPSSPSGAWIPSARTATW